MEVLLIVLYAAVIIVAILLGSLVLIQPSKSGGFGTVFGGVGESVFGARAGSHLTKATVVMTVIFFLLALSLASLIGHRGSQQGLLKQLAEPESTLEIPAVPGGAAAAESAAGKVLPEPAK